MRAKDFNIIQEPAKAAVSYKDILKRHREGDITTISCLSTIIKCIKCDEREKHKIYKAMDIELAYVSQKLGVSFKAVTL